MTSYYCHPTAVVDEGAQVGEGSKIWHFTHLMSGAQLGADVVCGQNVYVGGRVRVGSGCRIQNNVSLYDGVILEDDVFVGPSVVFTNVRRPRAAFPRKDAFETTLVKSGASIGANATIVCGTTLGVASFVAAGAVVTRDVPDFALVVGAPARQIGWVCRCGERLGDEAESRCAACQRRYRSGPEGLIELAHD